MSYEDIYRLYPRHRDKIFALRSINKALRRLMAGEAGRKLSEGEAVAFLLEKVTAFAQSAAGQRGQLTPYCATWMNRGGYLDDPAEWDLITPQEQKILKQAIAADIGVWRPQ